MNRQARGPAHRLRRCPAATVVRARGVQPASTRRAGRPGKWQTGIPTQSGEQPARWARVARCDIRPRRFVHVIRYAAAALVRQGAELRRGRPREACRSPITSSPPTRVYVIYQRASSAGDAGNSRSSALTPAHEQRRPRMAPCWRGGASGAMANRSRAARAARGGRETPACAGDGAASGQRAADIFQEIMRLPLHMRRVRCILYAGPRRPTFGRRAGPGY